MDHLAHVRAGQRELGFEPAHDLGDVLGFHALERAEHAFQIGLRRHEHPSPTVANGAEGFRHGLKIQHELGVLADELADFVHEKVQAETGGLPGDVVFDHLREAFDGNAIILPNLAH